MSIALTRRGFLGATIAAATSLTLGRAFADDAGADDQAWREVREFLFQDRPVADGAGRIRLEAPVRPANGADVSVRIIPEMSQQTDYYIRKHYLVVDKNPSPVGGVFTLSPRNGTAEIATRIRVNEYSHVRVIAETNRGELYMNSAFVKASGGCSAPPPNDDPMAQLTMGKMELAQKAAHAGDARGFQLSLLHPNNSGMQMDQVTMLFVPPHYVETVEVMNDDGETVFAAKGDITFSHNPSFDFFYKPKPGGDMLHAKAVDSRRKTYTATWPVVSG